MNFDPKALDDLARRLADAVPSGMRDLQQDMEKNFRSVLKNALERMDVVTREEFDVQAKVLARTREKLEQMTQRLDELEAELGRSDKK